MYFQLKSPEKCSICCLLPTSRRDLVSTRLFIFFSVFYSFFFIPLSCFFFLIITLFFFYSPRVLIMGNNKESSDGTQTSAAVMVETRFKHGGRSWTGYFFHDQCIDWMIDWLILSLSFTVHFSLSLHNTL